MLFSTVDGVSSRRDWVQLSQPIELLAWLFRAGVIVRLIVAGVHAIPSNRRLILTGHRMIVPLSAPQLIRGYGWVALHRVRGWILALGIVQLGIVCSAAFIQFTQIDWGMTCGNPCEITIRGLAKPGWLTPARLAFIVASASGLAVVESLCCTALGMAAALLVNNRLALTAAIAARFAPVIIFAWFPDFSGGSLFGRYHGRTWFSLADGGTGAILQMTYPVSIWADAFARGVLGYCAVCAMLVAIVYLSQAIIFSLMARRLD